MTGVTDAGASAAEQAGLFASVIESTERQVVALLEALEQLKRSRRAWDRGAAGERDVAAHVQQVMVELGSTDWHLLADRRWPGTRRANLDLLLVGPPGVLVIVV